MAEMKAVEIEGKRYYPASEVASTIGVSRQTLWRWRQEGKIPSGHRYRGRQILFSEQEYEAVKDYANRLEPIDSTAREQFRLFESPSREHGRQ